MEETEVESSLLGGTTTVLGPLTFFRGSGGGLDREQLLYTWLHNLPCSAWCLLMVEWCTMIRWGFWSFLKQQKMYWEKKRQRQTKGGDRRKDVLVYWHSHPAAHPQIFPSVLIALVNSRSLFIYCWLMQLKSHYVWMDGVPFCRAAIQIWVTPAGSWSFRINSGVSCHQNFDSAWHDLTNDFSHYGPLAQGKTHKQQKWNSSIHWESNSSSACWSLLVFFVTFHNTEALTVKEKEKLSSKSWFLV